MKRKADRFIREYFSYSVKEKNGMLVLSGILFCLLLARIFIWYLPASPLPSGEISWVNLKEGTDTAFTTKAVKNEKKEDPGEEAKMFPFDPNTATEETLITLGFTTRQAAGLIRFRESGAVFRKKEDLLKLYTMTPELYKKAEPWIRLPEKEKTREKAAGKEKESLAKSAWEIVDINLADSATLVRLKGIGAYSASRIIHYRNLLGGYADTGQYTEVKGLREEAITALLSYTRLDTQSIKKIDINNASEAELWKHPYIREKAAIIIKYRKEHGKYLEAADLLKTGVMSDTLIRKLLPYLLFV
jgi:competence protein ComEA